MESLNSRPTVEPTDSSPIAGCQHDEAGAWLNHPMMGIGDDFFVGILHSIQYIEYTIIHLSCAGVS